MSGDVARSVDYATHQRERPWVPGLVLLTSFVVMIMALVLSVV